MFNLTYEPKNAVVRFLRGSALFVLCQIHQVVFLAITFVVRTKELYFEKIREVKYGFGI